MILRIPHDFVAREHDEYNGQYGVYLSEQLIATFNERGQAKTCAKYLNAFLRWLGSSATVNVTELGDAINTFLTNASGSTGSSNGFNPALTIAS